MAACGGARRSAARPDDDARTVQAAATRPPAPDSPRAIGRAGLLVLADLPDGMHRWRPFRSSIACGGEDPFAEAQATVHSSRFHGALGDVQETIGVFRDARTATRAYRRLRAPAALACFSDRLHREIVRRADRQGARVSPPRRQILTCQPLGPHRSYAERFAFPVEKGPGLSGGVYIDVFENTLGRTVSSIVTVTRNEPFGPRLYEALVQRGLERIGRTVGVDPQAPR
jgi:hypothetical protein